MKLRHILAIILVVVLALLLLNKSDATEVILPPTSTYMPTKIKVETIQEFAAIPYDFAKNFPDELYYWWARAHNNREYDLLNEGRRVINRVGVESVNGEYTSDGAGRGNIWAARSAYSTSGSSQRQQSHRVFEFSEGGIPAIIYNPYARSTHGSQNQKE